MPRAGSPELPPGGAVPPAPMDIGEVANPPFAVLPEPATLFARRAERFTALAAGHPLEPYLTFMAAVARAQHECQTGLPTPQLPDPLSLTRAHDHAMPPISAGQAPPDAVFDATLTRFLDRLSAPSLSDTARATVADLAARLPEKTRAMADAVLIGALPADDLAAHVLVAAALQVHFARLAARLEADRLKPVADGACPSCGNSPVASMIVGRSGSHGTRFCVCSVCSTEWHVVRIKCLLCGEEKGVAYHSVEGGDETIKAETCESCQGYVKILHQHKNAALDPVADDVASLALDLLLQGQGWTRGGANPFLTGY